MGVAGAEGDHLVPGEGAHQAGPGQVLDAALAQLAMHAPAPGQHPALRVPGQAVELAGNHPHHPRQPGTRRSVQLLEAGLPTPSWPNLLSPQA